MASLVHFSTAPLPTVARNRLHGTWHLGPVAWEKAARSDAALAFAQGRYGCCEFILRQILAVSNDEHAGTEEGSSNVSKAQLMYRLAQCCYFADRAHEQEAWLARALALLDNAIALGDASTEPGCVARYRCIADLCACASRRAAHAKTQPEANAAATQALTLATRALGIAECIFGGFHTGTAEACMRYGACQQRLARYEQAEEAMRRAYGIRAAVDGERHPNTARVCNALAQLYRATHRPERAERFAALARACATPEQWAREQRMLNANSAGAGPGANSAALAQRLNAARANVMALPCDAFAREAVQLPPQRAIVPSAADPPHVIPSKFEPPPHELPGCMRPMAPLLPAVGVAAETMRHRKRTSTVGPYREAPRLERKPQVVPKLDLALVHDDELDDEWDDMAGVQKYDDDDGEEDEDD